MRNPCGGCRGTGQSRQKLRTVVPVPAGVEDGQTVRMSVGKPSKEIFITFNVHKSEYFRRQGADVHTDAKISVAQATLGGAIRVQGVHEDLNVHVRSPMEFSGVYVLTSMKYSIYRGVSKTNRYIRDIRSVSLTNSFQISSIF